jgi:hypothetical protein
MLKVFDQYTETTLSQISGYNEEYLRQLRRGNRPVTPRAIKVLRLALVSHGYNADGMFEEVEVVA